ncbi:hypothetical protein Y032_0053g2369 [Ancylostoma ceylanicum]|uniref:Uncharacterized protein n=1 Tax=Ancylostoma ceylanicum TaxID=53326 RepID=A0A016U6G6_9BILA|nr:hypothetical protein Y032_0053g2369 [Ancylostoma ceylanicum]
MSTTCLEKLKLEPEGRKEDEISDISEMHGCAHRSARVLDVALLSAVQEDPISVKFMATIVAVRLCLYAKNHFSRIIGAFGDDAAYGQVISSRIFSSSGFLAKGNFSSSRTTRRTSSDHLRDSDISDLLQ